jgi:excinuclease ABC subunit C
MLIYGVAIFCYLSKEKIKEIPKTPGVYAFRGSRGILYIGKATNLNVRAKSHFHQPTYRDDLFKEQVTQVGYIETDSEIEALILESQLIKKYKPRYNVLLKDDKQYFYVGFSKDKLPHLIITHQPKEKARYLGPFTDGKSLKTVLRYLRKAFPYYTGKHRKLPCSYCHIGLCPGPDPIIREYKKDIAKIKAILTGKKPRVITALKKEMAQFAKNLEFEKAAKARGQISALENIFSHNARGGRFYPLAGFEAESGHGVPPRRAGRAKAETLSGPRRGPRGKQEDKTFLLGDISSIEAYDISNIQGKEPVASMVRFDNGKPNKSMYRKFKIRLPETPDDFAMMREVIRRRLAHPEWPYPDVFLIDGGRGQLNAALSQMPSASCQIPVVALAKRLNELYVPGRKKPIPLSKLPSETKNLLMHARDEAHRFAVSYHRKLHRQKFK